MVIFGQGGCIRSKWIYSGKVVVFGQKWVNSGKVVVLWKQVVFFGQSGCIRAKVVVIGQKFLYSKIKVSIRARWL